MHREPSTSSRAHAARAPRQAVIALAAVACAALMGACGGSSSTSSSSTTNTKLNTARIAKSIEETILTKLHLHSTVVCPTEVPQEAGRTFECVATVTAAKPPHATSKTPFVVTIQNNRGYVTYVGR